MNTKAAVKHQQLRNPDPALWKKVKVAAIMEGKTMTQWVEEACRKQLDSTHPNK